jgi:predicted metal-dependent phosphoesterase TrpH
VLKVDFHVHTNRSPDGVNSLDRTLKGAKKAGLDAVAVTDHNRTLSGRRARDLGRRHGLLVIPGIEGGSLPLGKHWIAAGVDFFPPCRDIREVIDQIRRENGIAIAPHPHTRQGYGNYAELGFDAVEKVNGSISAANARVRNPERIPEVASSDAHGVLMLGFTWTWVDAGCSVDEILEAVRKGACSPGGTEIPRARTVASYAMAVARQAVIGLPLLASGIIRDGYAPEKGEGGHEGLVHPCD